MNTGVSAGHITIYPTTGTVTFGQNGGGGWWLSGPTLSTNVWHYIFVTYNGSQAKIYVDGLLVAGPYTNTFTGSHGAGYIGSYGGSSERFNGLIDEVRIYNSSF